jgi:hypothetical protein
MFFSFWDIFTEYQGTQNEYELYCANLIYHSLLTFKIKKLNDNLKAPKFFFLFNNKKELHKVKLEHSWLGTFEFDAVIPARKSK